MHIPDGFIDLRTSAAFAAVSAVAVAGAVKGARKQLSEQSAPLAGLTAVFIFAVKMPFKCRIKVVLPAPFGPSNATLSPCLIVRLTPYKAWHYKIFVLLEQLIEFKNL